MRVLYGGVSCLGIDATIFPTGAFTAIAQWMYIPTLADLTETGTIRFAVIAKQTKALEKLRAKERARGTAK